MPPVTVLLRGPTGVGKSTITLPFVHEVIAMTLPKD